MENNGWIHTKRAMVFIGDQGSGKSTVAKLISTFLWIEKALTKGQYEVKEFTNHNRFRKNYCAYHKIENYFTGTDKILGSSPVESISIESLEAFPMRIA